MDNDPASFLLRDENEVMLNGDNFQVDEASFCKTISNTILGFKLNSNPLKT